MKTKMEATMDVVELFAGVGGFRIGLDRVNSMHPYEHPFFNTIWSNQFEPSTKEQHASRTYCRNFGSEGHVNRDIALVNSEEVPVHDMLVGGFPCQDYSVARILSQATGIEGKKGTLWWQIVRIVKDKGSDSPSILFLENVDRLLGSPANQRGRDFAIMLESLCELGYDVEWRIINAAEYGMPQRRRRVYILAYRKNSKISNDITEPTKWLFNDGVFAKAFPVVGYGELVPLADVPLKRGQWNIADLSENFNKGHSKSPFLNAGLMKDGTFCTYSTTSNYKGKYMTLRDVLATGGEREQITEDYYIDEATLPRWEYLKGDKKEVRHTKDGFEFNYNEGSMPFPDPLEKPSRTIITSEGGKTPSRFKHVIKDPVNGRLRRLIPLELERLNMFPDNHTKGENDTKRAFFMGNALVCGIVTKVGEELYQRLHC